MNEGALALGLKLEVANARNEVTSSRPLRAWRGRGVGGLVITSAPFFALQIAQLASLAARYGLASNCAGANEIRTAAAAGALMRYGASSSTANHQAGIYVGCRPGDLPVMLPTRFELAINLKTAKALGIE